MTDFEYDVKEKKRIASGAYHQKKGSKSRKCTLPHELLTPAQRKKLDGPVLTYAINKPMSWEEFKSLPLDLQQDHLDFLQNRFDIGVNTVSALVFGLSHAALRYHCARKGLSFQAKPGTVNAAKREAIAKWLAREETAPAEETVAPILPAEDSVEEPEPETETEEKKRIDLSDLPQLLCGGEVRMSGRASELLPALVSLLGGNDAYMSVHFRFASDKEEKDVGKISEE